MQSRIIPGRRDASGFLLLVALSLSGPNILHAQAPGRPGGIGAAPSAAVGQEPAMPQTGKAQAPFDSSGYWVSLITRDWRFRMVVPGRGEYQGIPLSLANKQFADAWNPSADEAAGKQCEAYGAGVIMLVPERLLISWQDDDTLKVQTDAGMQTRLIHFNASGNHADSARSLQGYSAATWMIHHTYQVGVGEPMPAENQRFGSMKITTTGMLAGILRKNGVVYSDQSLLTEYWDVQRDPASQIQYLVDSATLHDPVYLVGDYYYSATFEKEMDGSKWHPSPCSLTAMP
jgi:hypothetical protein